MARELQLGLFSGSATFSCGTNARGTRTRGPQQIACRGTAKLCFPLLRDLLPSVLLPVDRRQKPPVNPGSTCISPDAS